MGDRFYIFSLESKAVYIIFNILFILGGFPVIGGYTVKYVSLYLIFEAYTSFYIPIHSKVLASKFS